MGNEADEDKHRSEHRQPLTAVLPSVVTVVANGPQGRSMGSGFLVADDLAFTCFHVTADATAAEVRTAAGETFAVKGYAATDRGRDVALLRLASPHLSGTPLTVVAREPPAALADVVAVGSPLGVEQSLFEGKISRVLPSQELPPRLAEFLSAAIGEPEPATWIQHTARLSEGNSGGPLVSRRGDVMGMNTWVDRRSGFGYAVSVAHLEDLLSQASGRTTPLVDRARMTAIAGTWISRLSAERLTQLQNEASARQWQVITKQDYQRLAEIAWGVTIANSPGILGGRVEVPQKQRLELLRAADRVVAELRSVDWSEPAHITLINEAAAREIHQAAAGAFCFCTVQRVCVGPDGKRGMIVEIAGMQSEAFIRLDGRLDDPAAGTQLLVLGINDRGATVHYGDNPLNLTLAPVIVSRTMIAIK